MRIDGETGIAWMGIRVAFGEDQVTRRDHNAYRADRIRLCLSRCDTLASLMNRSATKRGPFGFPKERRLRRNRDFERVRTNGRTVRGGALMLGVLEVSEEPAFKIGFVTSKRIGGAVARNRVRRRLREIVRRDQPRLRNGFWLVLVARPSAAKADYVSLEKEWGRLVVRAAIV